MVEDMNDRSMHLGHPLILPAKTDRKLMTFSFKISNPSLLATKLTSYHMRVDLFLLNWCFHRSLYYMSNILFSKKVADKIEQDTKNKPIYLKAWI
jgi:hypothetical protein